MSDEDIHSQVENQGNPVSQEDKENQIEQASHVKEENHSVIASQAWLGNQSELASHQREEDHAKLANSPASSKLSILLGHTAAGGYYDHQSVRISHMNRIRDILRKLNEGLAFDVVEEKKEKKKFDKKYSDANLPKLLILMEKEGKLSSSELSYIQRLFEIVKKESKLEADYIEIMNQTFSGLVVWETLQGVRGIGPVLASQLVHIFDITKAPHISSFWHFAGLQVVDGKAVKRKKGEKLEGDRSFNPEARKLCWKIATSFIRQNSPGYAGIYRSRKDIEVVKLKETEKTWKKHADMRARRYMMKMFLADFWWTWRELSNLPLSKPYVFSIMKHDETPGRQLGLPSQKTGA